MCGSHLWLALDFHWTTLESDRKGQTLWNNPADKNMRGGGTQCSDRWRGGSGCLPRGKVTERRQIVLGVDTQSLRKDHDGGGLGCFREGCPVLHFLLLLSSWTSSFSSPPPTPHSHLHAPPSCPLCSPPFLLLPFIFLLFLLCETPPAHALDSSILSSVSVKFYQF